MVVGAATARLTLAVLAISAGAATVGGTDTITTDCCTAKDGDGCCPQPPILDGAKDYGKGKSIERVVFASERCCPDGTEVVGCSAYGATGCSFCRDVCDKKDDSCVLCSVAAATSQTPAPTSSYVSVGEVSPSPTKNYVSVGEGSPSPTENYVSVGKVGKVGKVPPSPTKNNVSVGDGSPSPTNSYVSVGEVSPSPTNSYVSVGEVSPSPTKNYVSVGEVSPSPHDLETTDDLWGAFNDGSDEWNWNSDDVAAMLLGGSYEFSFPWGGGDGGAEEYDCSSCAWGDMSALKQRKLTERSRSMVCDSTCLDDAGHDEYGVTLCNYFNKGKECRACCHEGHMVEGCMPCEGVGSCNTCETKIKDLCREDPCDEECHAYVCCAEGWSEYSGCVDSMSAAVVELKTLISEQCAVDFTCDMTDPKCSDNARECSASVGDSRRLQEEAQEICAVVAVSGAGSFDADYAVTGPLSSELVFRAIGVRNEAYTLRSVSIDVCAGSFSLPYLDGTNLDTLVARSSTGRLAWDDGTELRPYALNTGVGCARHVWILQDTAGSHSHAFFAVDPSEHPRYITSDWVKVRLGGDMMRSDLMLSCTVQEAQVEWF